MFSLKIKKNIKTQYFQDEYRNKQQDKVLWFKAS